MDENKKELDNIDIEDPEVKKDAPVEPEASEPGDKKDNSANKDYTERGKSKIGVFFEKVGRVILLPFRIMLDFIHSVASWLKAKAFGDEYMLREGRKENSDLDRYESRQNAKQNIKHIEKVSEQWIEQAKMNGERSDNDITSVKCKVAALGADNKSVYQFMVTCENKTKYTIYADKYLKLNSNTICPEEVMVQLNDILKKCELSHDYVSPENKPFDANINEDEKDEEIPEENNEPDVKKEQSGEQKEDQGEKTVKAESPNSLVWIAIGSNKTNDRGNYRRYVENMLKDRVKEYKDEHDKFSYSKKIMRNDTISHVIAKEASKSQKDLEDKALLFYNGDVAVLIEKNQGENETDPTCRIVAYDNNLRYKSVEVASVRLNDTDSLKNAIKYVVDLQSATSKGWRDDEIAKNIIIDKLKNNGFIVDEKIGLIHNGAAFKITDTELDVKDFYYNNNGIISSLSDKPLDKELKGVLYEYNKAQKEAPGSEIKFLSKRNILYDIKPKEGSVASVSMHKLYVDEVNQGANMAAIIDGKDIDTSDVKASAKEILESMPDYAEELINGNNEIAPSEKQYEKEENDKER